MMTFLVFVLGIQLYTFFVDKDGLIDKQIDLKLSKLDGQKAFELRNNYLTLISPIMQECNQIFKILKSKEWNKLEKDSIVNSTNKADDVRWDLNNDLDEFDNILKKNDLYITDDNKINLLNRDDIRYINPKISNISTLLMYIFTVICAIFEINHHISYICFVLANFLLIIEIILLNQYFKSIDDKVSVYNNAIKKLDNLIKYNNKIEAYKKDFADIFNLYKPH